MMNQFSVSLPDPFTVTFSPARVCCHCPRWTHIGQASHEDNKHRSFNVQPQCHVHGYYGTLEESATPEEKALERASLERFIIWAMGECGTVTTIEPIPVDSIPHYDAAEHNEDWLIEDGYLPMGWKARYILGDVEQDVYPVYDFIDWRLSLYTKNGVVQK